MIQQLLSEAQVIANNPWPLIIFVGSGLVLAFLSGLAVGSSQE
jgi:hypothetical protein